jgi:hypothetical protein
MQRVTRCRIGRTAGRVVIQAKVGTLCMGIGSCGYWETRPGLFLAKGTVEKEQNADVMAQCRGRGGVLGELVIVINPSREVNGDGGGKGEEAI